MIEPRIAVNNNWVLTEFNKEQLTPLLNKVDYIKTYEVLNKYLGEKFGIHVPWPVNDNTED